ISKTQSVIHPDGSHFGEVGKPYSPLSDTTCQYKKWHELSELTLGALENGVHGLMKTFIISKIQIHE
ncbi:MAG: hypothetical protein NTZ71_13795, partial [Planctomycetota bacterium]|nr:hypothetical protein [Planctomycetota bacterium]